MPLPLVVFSHLRWDFVYQRPQHLLSRLARSRRVVVVEEPVRDEGEPHWERSEPAAGVTVFRPHTPAERWGFNDEQARYLEPLLDELAASEVLGGAVAWLYTPPPSSTTGWTRSHSSPTPRPRCAATSAGCWRRPTSSSPAG